ncbi:hypothetical protein [Halodesulfovibrio sp.]|uniref:Bbp19 family protein n=1 Tax=Halodesulfovibrio sp. TaxID=1912772 RepID=UPI0025F77E83|nr:hypothetical protein [Halodesulfovibrio sp.]MCT4626978.1 hypothetical protein [Halodesulfovibrio sp.]
MRSFRRKQDVEKPLADETRLAIRRVFSTPDGKVFLKFLQSRGCVDAPTYVAGKSYEDMIHHGARKALVCEVLEILKS